MRIRSVMAALLVGALPALGHTATYTVGSAWGCTHRTLQSAVDSARVQPGADVIRVTNSMSHVQQAIVIIGAGALQIEGGYAGCISPSPGATRTRIDGAGGVRAPVFRIERSNVELRNLEIVNGDADERGGGISIPNLDLETWTVQLRNVRVAYNRATDGGGISVRGNQTALSIGEDSIIEGNTATGNGGGLHCDDAIMSVEGRRSRIVANQALNGGGIHARLCKVELAGSGRFEDGDTIAFNFAHDSGGGAYFDNTGVTVFGFDPDRPAGFKGNQALRYGGALFAVDSAVDLHDAVIDSNVAGAGGGAAYLKSQSDVMNFRFFADPLLGAAKCPSAARCNRISNNMARDAKGVNQPGAAFLLVNGTVNSPSITLQVQGASLVGNAGRTLIQSQLLSPAPLRLWIRSSELRGNTVSGNLIELLAPPANPDWGDADVRNSTIAGNTIAGEAVLYSQRAMRVEHSIIWEPSRRVLRLGGPVTALETIYSIVSDLQGFAPSPTAMIADPRFVAAASGDLHLADDSPAIDYAPDEPPHDPPGLVGVGPDRDQNPRIDLATYGNRYGPIDLGAFERQTERVICCATFGGG